MALRTETATLSAAATSSGRGRCVRVDTGGSDVSSSGSDSTSSGSCTNVDGTWTIETACIGTGTATLNQTGCSFTITSSDIWANGAGTVSGTSIVFSGQVEGESTSCTGTVSGSSVSGTCTGAGGSPCSWTASR